MRISLALISAGLACGATAAQPNSHLDMNGYVFSMNGCQDTDAGGPREYASRSFTISIARGAH